MRLLSNVVRTLDSLDWSDLASTHETIEEVLAELYESRESLREEMATLGDSELEQQEELSHETTTHFKWYVHKGLSPRYKVWIHEYKERGLRRSGYAEVPHDHRYWFTSLVLLGGFEHHIYRVEGAGDSDCFESIEEVRSSECRKGTVYTVDPTMVHALSRIAEPTLTVVVRSGAVRPYSQTFDVESRKVTKYFPLSSRLANLKNIVALI
jgi:predicted metal-dependent enzyme (double-stranded beta helix superfamily)